MASSSGIGQDTIPVMRNVEFGEVQINSTLSVPLAWQDFPGLTQPASVTISGTLYVYHDLGHGIDNYLVVYVEDGQVNPGVPSISAQALTGGSDRGPTDPALGKGYFHSRMVPWVSAAATNPGVQSGIHWVGNSPNNANIASLVNDQVVNSVSTTVSVGSSPDGATASSSETDQTQTWTGRSFTVHEWGVEDTTDAATNRMSWVYYQTDPWDGRQTFEDFGVWWEQAYNMGGGWDDVKPPTALSTVPLDYTNIAAWRFDSSMKDANGQLNVVFEGGNQAFFTAIAMPQLRDTDHHQIFQQRINATWSKTVDLVALAKLL